MMDPAKLKQIQQEGGTVLQWKETRIKPLAFDLVGKYIDTIWSVSKDIQSWPSAEIEKKVLEDADEGLQRFCTFSHKSIFSILTSGKASERDVRNLKYMIEAKKKIAAGEDEQETINQLHQLFQAD
jgi:hypothetical protein